jgi:hypothetical protein
MAGVLIHIGYRKAASTFIKEWFSKHPQLYFSSKKITGFSKTTDIFKFIDSNNPIDFKYFVLSENFTLYRGPKPEKTKKNIQEYQANSCNLLYSLFPNAKILIVTRAPESSILSEYNESIKNGGHCSFKELLSSPSAYTYFECISDYNFTIKLFYNTFGIHNVIVLPYELLKDNPDSFIDHLAQSLKIEPFSAISSRLNSSLSPNDTFWHLKISKAIYTLSKPFGKFGNKSYHTYCNWLEKRDIHKKSFFILIKILTFLFGKKNKHIDIPEQLTEQLKISLEILNNIPEYQKYLDLYCKK